MFLLTFLACIFATYKKFMLGRLEVLSKSEHKQEILPSAQPALNGKFCRLCQVCCFLRAAVFRVDSSVLLYTSPSLACSLRPTMIQLAACLDRMMGKLSYLHFPKLRLCPLLQFQLPKTMQESVILTPRMSTFLEIGRHCQRLSERIV